MTVTLVFILEVQIRLLLARTHFYTVDRKLPVTSTGDNSVNVNSTSTILCTCQFQHVKILPD